MRGFGFMHQSAQTLDLPLEIYDKNFLFLESSSKLFLMIPNLADLELLKSPVQENTKPAPKPYSNLKDLLDSHKKSLKS